VCEDAAMIRGDPVRHAGVPVLYKLPLGHAKHLAALPLGLPATSTATPGP
jgi:muramoyltetrapeptide carboxypeptidase LdcA involved in peptidoglycan recycling